MAFINPLPEIWAKAKKVGVIGVILIIAQYVFARLFEDRWVSWANHKLDEKAGPMIKRLTPSFVKAVAEHPFQTSVYIFAVFSAILFLWAFVATTKNVKHTSGRTGLVLGTGQSKDGLFVWLENHTVNGIPECSLYLAGLHIFSEETREYSLMRGFSGVELVKPQKLGPHAHTKSGRLVWLPVMEAKYLLTFDVGHQRRPVITSEAGLWRAEINVILPEKAHTEECVFGWVYGSHPTFLLDPKKKIVTS